MSEGVERAEVRGRWGVTGGGYFWNAVMLVVARRVSWVAFGFVWVVAVWFVVFGGRARRGSMAYLDVMAGGKRGFLRRWWGTYRHMVEFGRLLLDRALILASEGHGYRIECSGLVNLREAVREAEGRGTGVVMLSAHFGNAEIGAPYMRMMGYEKPVHIVMYQAADGTERFHTEHRKLLAGVPIISTADPMGAAMKIMGALKKGDVVAMRADRTLAGKGVEVGFLGRKVMLPAGPFVAAVASGSPVVYLYTYRLGSRRYAFRVSGVHLYEEGGGRDERVSRAAQDYAAYLELRVKEFPFQWSNFYDYWAEQAPVSPPEPGR